MLLSIICMENYLILSFPIPSLIHSHYNKYKQQKGNKNKFSVSFV